jgi:hypothetical protein
VTEIPAVWPDTKLEAQMTRDSERPADPDTPIHVKALLARVRELEAEITKTRELVAYACTCKKRNTPEWMQSLADYLNAAIAAQGSDSRVKWPGSWANEFHLEI